MSWPGEPVNKPPRTQTKKGPHGGLTMRLLGSRREGLGWSVLLVCSRPQCMDNHNHSLCIGFSKRGHSGCLEHQYQA